LPNTFQAEVPLLNHLGVESNPPVACHRQTGDGTSL
jgi:hypothetical protein